MEPERKTSVVELIASHTVLCSFLAVLVGSSTEVEGSGTEVGATAAHALLNGVVVAIAVALFHLARRYANRSQWAGPRRSGWRREWLIGMGIGFCCGSLPILVIEQPWGLLSIAGLTFLLVVYHVRAFFRRVASLLAPGQYATWTDISHLVHVWATMIAAFTLINASIGYVHKLVDGQEAGLVSNLPLAGVMDCFYFTIVVMTTLGFGDITPATSAAKLIVAGECVTSYIMFALSVGMMTRGILPRSDAD